MKKFWKSLFFLGSASFAYAGPITSGGGMVVACQNSEVELQVLDYFEALRLYGEDEVLKASGDFREDYKRLNDRIMFLIGPKERTPEDYENSRKWAKKKVKEFFARVEWAHSDDLPFLGDQGSTVEIPSDCSLKQIAIFYDHRGKIKLAKDFWEKLDSINKATLILHELVYLEGRVDGDLSSEVSRAQVRDFLTGEHRIPVGDGIEKAQIKCQTKDFGIFHVHVHPEKTVLQFRRFAGRWMYAKTTAEYEVPFAYKEDERYKAIPEDDSADFSQRVPIQSENGHYWDLEMIYKGKVPITLQAFRGERKVGEKQDLTCW